MVKPKSTHGPLYRGRFREPAAVQQLGHRFVRVLRHVHAVPAHVRGRVSARARPGRTAHPAHVEVVRAAARRPRLRRVEPQRARLAEDPEVRAEVVRVGDRGGRVRRAQASRSRTFCSSA
jgi:hypothetical protein